LLIGAISAPLGGNLRIGLEESLWIGSRCLAESNAQQVLAARQTIERLSLEAATPNEARERLSLKRKD
jgi:uncharacterized protein (DUF849 family)